MRNVRDDRPLDRASIDILKAVKTAARGQAIPVMIVGATARDIMLTHLHDIPARRATEDMDFALAVPDWETFNAVTRQLTTDPRFVMSSSMASRVIYRADDHGPARSVDIIPYGAGIGGDLFRWPDGDDIEMNVTGYRDAALSAESIGLASDLDFKVVTLAGLTLLKYFAWIDRRNQTRKDASDLFLLLHTYADAGNLDRLYDSDIDTLSAVDFRLDLASPRLLGRDVGRLCSGPTRDQLLAVLNQRDLMNTLALDMARTSGTDSIDTARIAIDHFEAGFRSYLHPI